VVCEMYRSTGGHCCGKRSKWADDIEVSAHRDNQRVALSLSLSLSERQSKRGVGW
jgi:hypothetical protein